VDTKGERVMNVDILKGVNLVTTGYVPNNIAILVGRRDTRLHYDGWRSERLFMVDREIIGKIDFNTGDMGLLKNAHIEEIRADEPTIERLKKFFTPKEEKAE
jgi:hypothetical protein